jgi:hypothetical protein
MNSLHLIDSSYFIDDISTAELIEFRASFYENGKDHKTCAYNIYSCENESSVAIEGEVFLDSLED